MATETVTVVRPPVKDTWGNRPATTAQSWEVPGWRFAPGPSRELQGAANTVESDGTLYGPTLAAIATVVPGGIKASDVMRVRGDDYAVIGRVQDWGRAGTVIVLKYVTG